MENSNEKLYGQAAKVPAIMIYIVNDADPELHRLHVLDCRAHETLDTLRARIRPLKLAKHSASIEAASATDDAIATAAGNEYARALAALDGLPPLIGAAARESRLAAIAFLTRLAYRARESVRECDEQQAEPDSAYQQRVRTLKEIQRSQSGVSVEAMASPDELADLQQQAAEYGAEDRSRAEWRGFCALVGGLAECGAQSQQTTLSPQLLLSPGPNGKTLVLAEAAADQAAQQAEQWAEKEAR